MKKLVKRLRLVSVFMLTYLFTMNFSVSIGANSNETTLTGEGKVLSIDVDANRVVFMDKITGCVYEFLVSANKGLMDDIRENDKMSVIPFLGDDIIYVFTIRPSLPDDIIYGFIQKPGHIQKPGTMIGNTCAIRMGM